MRKFKASNSLLERQINFQINFKRKKANIFLLGPTVPFNNYLLRNIHILFIWLINSLYSRANSKRSSIIEY